MHRSADQPQAPRKPAARTRYRVRNGFLASVIIIVVALLGWRLSWPRFASPAEDLSYRVTELVSAFLYYAPEQDVYIAGTVNQTAGQAQALTLVLQALAAVR